MAKGSNSLKWKAHRDGIWKLYTAELPNYGVATVWEIEGRLIPANLATGNRYSGCNVFLLWITCVS